MVLELPNRGPDIGRLEERHMTASGGPPGLSRLSIQELLTASVYPHAIVHLRLKETHLSWVILTGRYAYKLKKPVKFAFVDATTLERRRFLCHEELRLNHRFAPELYVDVVPVTRESGRLRVGGAGEPVEYAVRMQEFDESQELASRLDHGSVSANDMQGLAIRLADAHRLASVAAEASPYGTIEAIRQPMFDNFSLLRAHLGDAGYLRLIERLEDWTHESLTRRQSLVESRRLAGLVRECHGDLHARNIVHWQQQWLPFDCLEFDPALRWIDVISDVSFLYMDLVSRSRKDLASHFLSRYLEVSGDYNGLPLVPLYSAYLALVRAKVDVLGAENASPAACSSLRARRKRRLETAARFVDAVPPALIAMHGVTASGKSWLSERLIGEIPAVRVRSDLERKRLAGVAALATRGFGVGEGDYSELATQATYDRLLACAEAALDGPCSVIIDAAFLDRRHRDAFRALAQRKNRPFLLVSCFADSAVLASRLDARAGSGADPSEATHAVLSRQLRDTQPLGADEAVQSLEFDMGRRTETEVLVKRVRERLGTR
ncbi:MAG: AAA family ATPase [Steroidobacteraceae bacterium]